MFLQFMLKKITAVLAATVVLAACRESNITSQQSTPGEAQRVLRLDTTFFDVAQRTQAYRYVTQLHIGKDRGRQQASIPVEIDWTSTQVAGCPQVAAIQVYQLNGDDRGVALMASARRDGVCRAGLQANGKLGSGTTGAALVSLTGSDKAVKFFTSTQCLVNALGFHDSLSYDNAATRR